MIESMIGRSGLTPTETVPPERSTSELFGGPIAELEVARPGRARRERRACALVREQLGVPTVTEQRTTLTTSLRGLGGGPATAPAASR